jgi:two-component system OmpR family response regulator
VVEDEAILLMDVEMSLLNGRYEVIACTSGVKAIQAFEATPRAFSALLTDIRLGRGPSGWEIARHARQLAPELPVVYLSADTAADWPAHGVCGSQMISRPCIMEDVTATLATLLDDSG